MTCTLKQNISAQVIIWKIWKLLDYLYSLKLVVSLATRPISNNLTVDRLNAIVRCVCVVWDIGREWNFPDLVDLSQPADKSLKGLAFCLIFFQYCKIISYLQSNEFQQENSLWDWVLSRSVKQQADSTWRIKMMMVLTQQSPCLKVMAEFYMITGCNIQAKK